VLVALEQVSAAVAKQLANQSGTRRQALKKFGVGLAGMALACFGLANKAQAAKACKQSGAVCRLNSECCSGFCYKLYGQFTARKFGTCFNL
jgi:hypothetical protein